MQDKNQKQKTVTDEEIRKLVIVRLRALPSQKRISIGSDGEFTIEDLIERVKENDKIGQKIIEIQLSYLRSLKEGILFNEKLPANNPS
jgi:hypothetical protein